MLKFSGEVAMGDKLTEKTALLSELGDPEKVAKKAGDESPATLDSAETDEVDAAIAKRKNKIQPILDYLKDK